MEIQNYLNLLLDGIKEEHTNIVPVIKSSGDLSLYQYTREFRENSTVPIQSPEDLIRVSGEYANRILGARVAAKLEKQLRQFRVLVTSNHHGVDYARIQTSILYALPDILDISKHESGVIPIFAYGSVPLNNPTYPRGIMLSRKKRNSENRLPVFPHFVKIGIYPDSEKHTIVSAARPFTSDIIKRSIAQTEKCFNKKEITEEEFNTIQIILSQEYLNSDVLNLMSYSDQVVRVNHNLWKRIFSAFPDHNLPEMVYLEMEKIVSDLLKIDFHCDNSLTYRVLFDPDLREATLSALNGKTGCWDFEKIADSKSSVYEGNVPLDHGGTVFFWGIGKKGQRIHLSLVLENGRAWLKGTDRTGEKYLFPFTPEDILTGLHEQQLLPGLFLTFLVIAFARGFRCLGGPWQVTYLPVMQQGLINALYATSGYEMWATRVESIPTNNYLSGLTAVLSTYPNGISPAGSVELISKGGLSPTILKAISELTVRDTMLYFLLNNYVNAGNRDCSELAFSDISSYLIRRLPQITFAM